MKFFVISLLALLPILANAQVFNDSKQNVDELNAQYNNGTIAPKDILYLTLQIQKLKQDSLALVMAKAYKTKYLDKGDPSKILEPKQIDFLSHYNTLFNTKDNIVKYIYSHQKESDNAFSMPGYSMAFTDNVIAASYVNPFIINKENGAGNTPSWNVMENKIAKSYDSKTAHRLVLNAKVYFYLEKKDWNSYIRYNIEKIDMEGVDTSGFGAVYINNFIYNVVFQYTEDPAVLSKCIGYMEKVLKVDPNSHTRLDTYACILYKAGQKSKALVEEQKALQSAEDKKEKGSIKEYTEKIEKMKNNLPTWQ
jgi:hypothetical protein